MYVLTFECTNVCRTRLPLIWSRSTLPSTEPGGGHEKKGIEKEEELRGEERGGEERGEKEIGESEWRGQDTNLKISNVT